MSNSSITGKVFQFDYLKKQLLKTSSYENISKSDNGKYFYVSESIQEVGSMFYIYDAVTKKRLLSLNSKRLIDTKYKVIWNNTSLRVLSAQGLFDIKSKKIDTKLNKNFWLESARRPKPSYMLYADIASDWDNYILMLNSKRGLLEIQDINTSKIIKTYNKFWK